MDDCPHCERSGVVPVLDVSMTNRAKGGNPYRRRCLKCSRWLPSTSKEAFKNHLHPHVLPRGEDPDDPDAQIPLEDWDYAERYQEVLDRIKRYRAGRQGDDGGQAVATDGGQEIDDQGDGQEESNRFDCPACGVEVTGYPDECPNCSAAYDW